MLALCSRTRCRCASFLPFRRAPVLANRHSAGPLPPLSSLSQRKHTLNFEAETRPAHVRYSSSNSRWKQRQGSDVFAREAKVQGLKSRAAFKLLEVRIYVLATMARERLSLLTRESRSQDGCKVQSLQEGRRGSGSCMFPVALVGGYISYDC